MTLQDILNAKGSAVHTIEGSATLDDVVQRLVQRNCGSLVVVDSPGAARPRMVGIITERDILRACAVRHPLSETSVASTMTRRVVTGAPTDSIDDTMQVLTRHRVRHLPILQDGDLVGIISIGDVVKARQEQAEFENHYLKSYIQS